MVEIQKICCFQLPSFTLIWGWLGSIYSGLELMFGLIALSFIDIYGLKLLFLSVFTFLMFLSILTSVGLIFSVLKENHKYMLPWIFHEMVSLILEIITMIALLIACFASGSPFSEMSSSYEYDGYGNDGYGNYRYRNYMISPIFMPILLICKIVANIIRIYIFIGIWSLFKNYRRGTEVDFQRLIDSSKSNV
ncbi:hypothetical protein ACFFRR_004003 [Megaselia abdita]